MDTTDLRKGLEHTLRSLLPLAPREPPVEVTRLTDDLGVGAHPVDARAVEALEQAGYAAIVNLAEEGEPDQEMTPNVEATWAHTFDLEHQRVQTRLPLEAGEVDAFLEALGRASRPVFVHSTHGARAAALCGIALAVEHDLDGRAALRRLDEAGLRLDDEGLRRAVVEHVAGRAAEADPDGRSAGDGRVGRDLPRASPRRGLEPRA